MTYALCVFKENTENKRNEKLPFYKYLQCVTYILFAQVTYKEKIRVVKMHITFNVQSSLNYLKKIVKLNTKSVINIAANTEINL